MKSWGSPAKRATRGARRAVQLACTEGRKEGRGQCEELRELRELSLWVAEGLGVTGEEGHAGRCSWPVGGVGGREEDRGGSR